MIELQDVRKTYRKGTEQIHALAGITLTVARGEFVAVIGPSGSGKSTLMNMIGLLDRPDAGTYRLDGKDVSGFTPDQLANLRNEKIGFVFQTFHLLARTTALENVELPLVYSERPYARGQGMRALERVGLADRATHFPSELSGGQQQRVAIARALVQEPPLILADEPTGNLDSKSSSEIMDILRQLHESGSTIVVITHDQAVSRHADRVLTIVDGRITTDARAIALMVGT
jgi:ABC-type lipoprotein export system ATPase subunit